MRLPLTSPLFAPALVLTVATTLATALSMAGFGRCPGDRIGELPPYVVIPEDRPWESEEFAKLELPFELARAADGSKNEAVTSEEAGLTRLERGSVVLFHSPGRAELAAQVADLFERQHRLLYWTTGQRFQSYAIVVVGNDEELPAVSLPFWVEVDGLTGWKLITGETELPLRTEGYFWADVARSWLYHGTIHESCHHGTCYWLKLMPYRWFCEGLSDYVGATAAVCYAPDLDKAHVADWIEALEALEEPPETIDVLSGEVWWAPGGGRRQDGIETAAYAASLFSIARLVADHGHAWIAPAFAEFERTPPADADALLRVIEKQAGAEHLRERLEAVPLADVIAYLKQGMP